MQRDQAHRTNELLERIAIALEKNVKYKVKNNQLVPDTKDIPGFEGTLDALDNLCNVGTNPKNDPERDKFGNDIPCKIDGITNDSDYRIRLVASNFKEDYATKKDAILDYVELEFGSEGARYTDIIKFAYYLGAPNAVKFGYKDRGYYACAISGRNAHLIRGGKDFLVKGINKEGDERYFAHSFVESVTDYWKYI